MTLQPDGDAVYALGHTEDERQRLIEQDQNFGPVTARFFAEAGLGEGMRVLDQGCGAGDVSFRVAELVGTSGSVVGVDSDAVALATARQRALPQVRQRALDTLGVESFAQPC